MCSWDSWTCFDAATFFGMPYMSMAQHVHPMSHGILCISSPGTRWRENMQHLRPGLIVSAVIMIILQKFNIDTNMAIFGAYMLNFSGIWFRILCVTRVRYKGTDFFTFEMHSIVLPHAEILQLQGRVWYNWTFKRRCHWWWLKTKDADKHMGVSKNSGIPKWMIYNGKPY